MIYFWPAGDAIPRSAQSMLAVASLILFWWMSETLPLGITALLPLVLYPLCGIMKTSAVAPNYMDHLVFLFFGGFLIAIALQQWGLHRKFAFMTLAILGNNGRTVILAFMLASALLSMWISNTATTIMMVPIAMAVIQQLSSANPAGRTDENLFATVLLLGIAYSSSMGGLATVIGTPPNIIFRGIFHKFFPELPELDFLHWILFMFPLSTVLFTVIWLYLTFVVLRKAEVPMLQSKSYFITQYRELGPLTTPQKWVLGIFITTAFLWIFRSDLPLGFLTVPGWPTWLGLGGRFEDSTIAIGMALFLFIIHVRHEGQRQPLLKIQSILNVPWDVLLLFGGGFALAEGIQQTGLAEILGNNLAFLRDLPPVLTLFILTLGTAFITEVTSNTAVATAILPVSAALAIQLNVDPRVLMLPVTIASSCAFMLPVATPPNAIVFGSRMVAIRRMIRIGIALNLIVSLIVTGYFYLLFRVFGFAL